VLHFLSCWDIVFCRVLTLLYVICDRRLKFYAVVAFTKHENLMDVVPTCWLDGTKSYWPPYKDRDEFDQAVKISETPTSEWRRYAVRILGVKGTAQ
jgi:hypothetical protein